MSPNPKPTWSSLPSPIPDSLKRRLAATIQSQVQNSNCFDCSARCRADWCSVTFGVFVCLDCSGKHRNFGVHISFVRSLEMDKLSANQILSLLLGGNLHARTIQSNQPKGSVEWYTSRAADKYRELLNEKVEEEMRKACELWDNEEQFDIVGKAAEGLDKTESAKVSTNHRDDQASQTVIQSPPPLIFSATGGKLKPGWAK